MKNSNSTFSSYADFVHYISHIQKKTQYEKYPFYVKLVHKISCDLAEKTLWNIRKKFCDAEVKMLCSKGLNKPKYLVSAFGCSLSCMICVHTCEQFFKNSK